MADMTLSAALTLDISAFEKNIDSAALSFEKSKAAILAESTDLDNAVSHISQSVLAKLGEIQGEISKTASMLERLENSLNRVNSLDVPTQSDNFSRFDP